MVRCLVVSLCVLALARELTADEPLPSPPGEFARIETVEPSPGAAFVSGKPLIATTYFYWYDVESGAHFIDGDGSDALTTHPATSAGMSYNNVAWHKQQLADMSAAGIDVAMPVYWGAPDGSHDWSDRGLPKLVAARDELLRSGKPAPAIGMFYDTSTLQHNRSRFHADMTTSEGQRWFYGTIRNFYSLVPAAHRATIDGKPLVYLYVPAFAAKVDETLFPNVRKLFRDEFGTDLFLVKTSAWPGEADGEYEWGAALEAKYLDTAAIGPGYDHSAVPGRTPLVRDREDGLFYSKGWARLLSMDPARRPWLVHLETWNEFHEGTDLCESREYGRAYIELTREFADLFHAGKQANPRNLATTLNEVSATPETRAGLRVPDVRDGDGPIVEQTVAGRTAWTTTKNRFVPEARYLYVDVDADFFCDGGETVEVAVDYLDAGPREFRIEYDSGDPALTGLAQRFRSGPTRSIEGSGRWKRARFKLPHARFMNRANNNDFRLVCVGADLSVSRIAVRRLLDADRATEGGF